MSSTRRSGVHSWPWAAVPCAALLVLGFAASLQAAELPQAQINECNSDLMIGSAPASPVTAGSTVTFTLTVSSTDARDNLDNPIPQVFDRVAFGGDCSAFFPCVPNVPADVMYQGNVGGTCPGVVPNPMGNGQVEFDFVPDLALTVGGSNPPGPPYTPDSCTITFDVVYTAGGVFAQEANVSGVCQNPSAPLGTYTSDTTVTNVLTAVAPASLAVEKTCDAGPDASGNFTFTVTLTNDGSADLDNCFITDPGATCGALSATSLAPTETATATCTSMNLNNTVDAQCDAPTGTPNPVMATDSVTCVPVPTMGEAALITLALLIGLGSLAILNRRRVRWPGGF